MTRLNVARRGLPVGRRLSVGSDFRRFEGQVDRATRSCGKAQTAGIRCMTCVDMV